jgi:hypothetical protein
MEGLKVNSMCSANDDPTYYANHTDNEAFVYWGFGLSNALAEMRHNIARENGWNIAELRSFDNYFAPGIFTGFDAESGTHDNLWADRRRDGELWSAFLARDIKRAF